MWIKIRDPLIIAFIACGIALGVYFEPAKTESPVQVRQISGTDSATELNDEVNTFLASVPPECVDSIDFEMDDGFYIALVTMEC
jgi:hypothetical protein